MSQNSSLDKAVQLCICIQSTLHTLSCQLDFTFRFPCIIASALPSYTYCAAQFYTDGTLYTSNTKLLVLSWSFYYKLVISTFSSLI